MSTYEPGRLYLIDLDGETHEARYFANGINPPYFQLREGHMTHRDNAANVRLAIVLDPEDENVQTLMRGGLEVEELDTAALSLVHKIRDQITPPEPPMEEPTEWGEKVTDDRGDWMLVPPREPGTPCWVNHDGDDWSSWDDMQNPRKYENPREKPATAPQSDAQGSGSGIGRVSESEASEGAPAHAEAWVGITISRKDRP